VKSIHYGDAVPHRFAASDLICPIEIAITACMGKVFIVESQFQLTALMRWVKNHFQLEERAIPELKTRLREYAKSTLPNLRHPPESCDEKCGIAEGANNVLPRSNCPSSAKLEPVFVQEIAPLFRKLAPCHSIHGVGAQAQKFLAAAVVADLAGVRSFWAGCSWFPQGINYI
jgi:hypothetical protein